MKALKIIGLVAVLLAVVGVSVYAQIKWRAPHYFGSVVSVSDTALVIADPKDGTVTVRLTEDTLIKRGTETLSAVPPGETVVVFAKRTDTDPEAVLVRVVDDAPPRPPRHRQ